MRLGILALALLATGCNDLPPTPENISATFKETALKALKKETPGDIQMKDFRMYVYMPDKPIKSGKPENMAYIYMCGAVAGRDSAGWRSSDEPVIVWGNVMYNDKKVIGKAVIAEVQLVERIKDRFEKRFAQRNLDEECQGKEFTLEDPDTGVTRNYTPHTVVM